MKKLFPWIRWMLSISGGVFLGIWLYVMADLTPVECIPVRENCPNLCDGGDCYQEKCPHGGQAVWGAYPKYTCCDIELGPIVVGCCKIKQEQYRCKREDGTWCPDRVWIRTKCYDPEWLKVCVAEPEGGVCRWPWEG
jgi:hypothetical protein